MGTAEVTGIKIIEFLLNNNYYGIHAKFVKKNTSYQQVAIAPNAPPDKEGVFYAAG